MELHTYQRRRGIKNRTRSASGYLVFWIGMLLLISGLCILFINLLRR